MCFRILFDRNVYNSSGSSLGLSHFTMGISTAATLTDGCSFIVVFLEADFMFSMHLLRFSSLHSDSTVNNPGDSLNVRFKFISIVLDVNIVYKTALESHYENLIIHTFL